MKHNNYYRQVLRRKNPAKEFSMTLFQSISSIPRMLLEVFIRKNFGERYFSFSMAIIVAFFLGWVPFAISSMQEIFSPGGLSYYAGGHEGKSFWSVIGSNFFWYAYLGGFVYMCLQRRKEITTSKSSFDFGKYSLYNGDIYPYLLIFRDSDGGTNIRLIETTIEPAFFFCIGLAFTIIGQSIGVLILLSSIFYAMSYRMAYYIGDNFILDTIDELICNEELVKFFVEGREAREARGFRPYGRRPADAQNRQKVADEFTEDIDYDEVK